MAEQGTLTLSGLPINGDTVDASDGQATAIQQIVDEFNKTVGTAKITNLAVTTAKIAAGAAGNTIIRDSGACSVIGRADNSAGDPADISATDGQVLRRSGATLGFGTIATAGIADGAVTGSKLATTAITLGYAEITADFTDATIGGVDVTGLSVAVTVPAGGRRIKITAYTLGLSTAAVAGNYISMRINESTTQLASSENTIGTGGYCPHTCVYSAVVGAGSHTYKVRLGAGSAGNMILRAGATSPAFILVEAI